MMSASPAGELHVTEMKSITCSSLGVVCSRYKDQVVSHINSQIEYEKVEIDNIPGDSAGAKK